MKLNRLLALGVLVTAIAACSTERPPAAPVVQEVITVNQTFYYNSVWFPNNSSQVSDDFDSVITLNANYLMSNPMAQVQIQGNASETGSPEHNQKLAKARAKAVTERLVAAGVNKAQIQEVSFGSGRPLFNEQNGHTPKNRRVDIVYISGAPMPYFIEILPVVATEDESVDFEPISVQSQKAKVKSISSSTVANASAPTASAPITAGTPVDGSSDDASAPVMMTQ